MAISPKPLRKFLIALSLLALWVSAYPFCYMRL